MMPGIKLNLPPKMCTLITAIFFLSPPASSQEQFDIVTAPGAQSATFSWADSYGKSPTRFSREDWQDVIDATWGAGLPTEEKLRIFDAWFTEVDLNYGSFFNLDFDIFAFRDRYRPEIEAGVSRGRFAAIMNYFGYFLKDLHTYIFDIPVRNTALAKGIPLLVVGQWGTNQHFGALLTPLPESTLLVYKTLPNHPLGLQPGDLVLGYDDVLWKDIYPELVEAQLPLLLNSVNGSTDESMAYYHLQAAGLNWHLFDTIDIVKYSSGDTLHFATRLLAGQRRTIWGSEQIGVPGVSWPDRSRDIRVNWGVIDNTNIGYIYVTSWSFDARFDIRDKFRAAVDRLMHEIKADGIVMDFRFNTGGGALAIDGLKLLFNQVTPTVGFDKRAGTPDHFDMISDPLRRESNLVIQPDLNTYYDKPIAVLIGPGSISAGELEAIRLSFHPRTRLFGKPAAGGNSGSDFLNLATNWFASRTSGPIYYVSNHEYLSHISLQPDEPVWFNRDDVANGIDTVAEAAIAWIKSETPTSVRTDQGSTAPVAFELGQNYPNPFNPTTSVRYELTEPVHVTLKIFNALGREIRTLVDAMQEAGTHSAVWNGHNLSGNLVSTGIYFYQLQAGSLSAWRRMTLLK